MNSPKIKDYTIVRGSNVSYMTREVMAAIKKGFVPLGGVSVGEQAFNQAMVKYETPETPKTA